MSEDIRGLEIWENAHNEYTVIRVHYTADPYKDPQRLVCKECGHDRDIRGGGSGEKVCTECGGKMYAFGKRWVARTLNPLPYQTRQREYEIDFTTQSGKRVTPNFRRERHVAEFAIPPRPLIYRGWDFGRHHPAVSIFIDNQLVGSIQVLEVLFGSEISFHIFCDEVVKWCRIKWPEAEFLEGVDPQGSWANPTGGLIDLESDSETNVEYMRNVHGLDVDWLYTKPENLVEILLDMMARGPQTVGDLEPFLIRQTKGVHIYRKDTATDIKSGTNILIDGFSGHWHYSSRSDGSFTDKPVKNAYSHPADALLYGLARARKMKKLADATSDMTQYRQRAEDRDEPDKYGIFY